MKSIILLAFLISVVEVLAQDNSPLFADLAIEQEISYEEEKDILNAIKARFSTKRNRNGLNQDRSEDFTWSNGKVFFHNNSSIIADNFREALLSNNVQADPVLLDSLENDKLEVGVLTRNTGESFYVWVEKKESLLGTRFQRPSIDISNPFSEGIGAGYSIKIDSNSKIGIENRYSDFDNENVTGLRFESKF